MQKYDQENPKLINSMVCTIDILGFSQMIVDSCSKGYGNKLLNEDVYKRQMIFKTYLISLENIRKKLREL